MMTGWRVGSPLHSCLSFHTEACHTPLPSICSFQLMYYTNGSINIYKKHHILVFCIHWRFTANVHSKSVEVIAFSSVHMSPEHAFTALKQNGLTITGNNWYTLLSAAFSFNGKRVWILISPPTQNLLLLSHQPSHPHSLPISLPDYHSCPLSCSLSHTQSHGLIK